MIRYDYKLEVYRTFAVTEKLNENGKPECFPVVIRRMILISSDQNEGDNAFPRLIKIIRTTRNEVARYSINHLQEIVQDKWHKVVIPTKNLKFKKFDMLNEEDILLYLSARLGKSRGVVALHELITTMPVKRESEDEDE